MTQGITFNSQGVVPQAISTQPIADMQFRGLHWIEASAGTGKTYTLSSLMVRILLEEYLPKQVIATTFTRKAAAELKSRIRARLQEMLREFEACRELTQEQVLARAQAKEDSLHQILLRRFAGLIDHGCNRLKLVLDQLEELFVGTLDSFSQKLLREFAFECGKIERAYISPDAKQYTAQLIHDVLREWIQLQPQGTIDFLLLKKKLKSQDAYIDLIENSLNFSSAYFKEVPTPQCHLDQFKLEVDALLRMEMDQLQSLADYYLPDGACFQYLAKKWRDEGRLEIVLTKQLPQFILEVQQHGPEVMFSLHLEGHLKSFQDLRKKVLNKCPAEVLSNFEQHPCIQGLTRFLSAYDQLVADLDLVDTYLQYHLAREVKIRLPALLQQKSETTFAQQIRSLAESLQGEQGQQFARYVHSRYPLILVDEFQDTNQDQDDMLAQIWRHPERLKQGCMIMVGDRKQAIYGFRGGDMLTFLKAYQDVMSKAGRCYQLVYNHRSVPALVEVVDALFQQQPDFGEQVLYTPVSAGPRRHPALMDQGCSNPVPLRWLQVENKEMEIEQVAWNILELLNRSTQGQLYFELDEQRQALAAEDIAVISRNNPDLEKMHHALLKLGIQVNRPSKKSVFHSGIARDVAALLTAIMNPFDEAKIRRALLTRLMGFNLERLTRLQLQPEGLSRYIADFDDLRDMWMTQGFLTAWQSMLSRFHVWQNLVEQFSFDNERDIVNLRHISELLSQYSEEYSGLHTLYHWYMRQLSDPKDWEWEIERQLTNQAGVQLLTIHQSKGLEFKIVFLLGADRKLSDQSSLNFSIRTVLDAVTGQQQLQRVVAIKNQSILEPVELEQHDERALAEHRRLWYVALTRAQHRVYAMLSDTKGQSCYGLAYWRGQGEAQFQHALSQQEPVLAECPERIKAVVQQQERDLVAQALPQRQFYPRGKTSFSYLAQHLSHRQIQDLMAANEEASAQAEDELHVLDIQKNPSPSGENTGTQLAWIRWQFPMGTLAGNFLHEIFEHIDFQDRSAWALEVRRRFKNAYTSLWQDVLAKFKQEFPQQALVEEHLIELMLEWLTEIIQTPIQPDFSLGQLPIAARLSEFPFYLALADHVLSIQRIHQLFAEYGIQMPEFHPANAARYLNGSIDLVYFDGQRYHIADYKSNFLGGQVEDYAEQQIQQSMTHASYWLQAALYLVALHRYLNVHLEHYDIQKDLGGAHYLYLRGMSGQAQYGVASWQPEVEFILRLDAILGYFSEDKFSIKA